jgi:hypothetical protein
MTVPMRRYADDHGVVVTGMKRWPARAGAMAVVSLEGHAHFGVAGGSAFTTPAGCGLSPASCFYPDTVGRPRFPVWR